MINVVLRIICRCSDDVFRLESGEGRPHVINRQRVAITTQHTVLLSRGGYTIPATNTTATFTTAAAATFTTAATTTTAAAAAATTLACHTLDASGHRKHYR